VQIALQKWASPHQAKGGHLVSTVKEKAAGENQCQSRSPVSSFFLPSSLNEQLFLWAFGWCQVSVNVAKDPKSSWWVDAPGTAYSSAGRWCKMLVTVCPDFPPRLLGTNGPSLESLKLGLELCLFPSKFMFRSE
jgi:hypothetical protein